ncbi:TonB-dependent receptor [Pedobacter sp. PLR]|uniref:TonB-dependent receptor n=1 Tax=Pedobacter sp. PLR TaxID=2994465 RepID=UPI0022466F0B|nr:TonB-dependent receptor [Pedobacter sp. PLR]MCX2454254.1 TonB-dependent receptor [Pedobacter sp. PLR]
MLNKKIFLLAGFILCQLFSYGQTILSGKVQSADGLPMPGVSIRVVNLGLGTSTDSIGRFRLRANSTGNYLLRVSAIGYLPDSLRLLIKGDSLKVNFILRENNHNLAGIEILNMRNLTEVNRDYTLSPIAMVLTAGAAADVTAALQTFPGAAPAGNETGFFVRGGTAAETTVLFDGMLVKNAFGSRLPDLANRSRFSAFLFDKTTFSTNGYAAANGQALSSVLTLDTRGVAQKSSTEFALISLGLGAAHTHRFKNSSLTLGGNYYNFSPYNSLVPQYTLWEKDPEQKQLSLHYKLKTSGTGMLKVFTDYSDTRLSFNIKNPNYTSLDLLSNRNKNLYFNTNYQDFVGSDWKVYAGAAYNSTLESGEVNDVAYHQDDKVGHQKLYFARKFRGSSLINLGGELFENTRSEGYGGTSRSYSDVLAAGFVESELYFTDQLNLKSGLRLESSSYLKKMNLAPRTALYYQPDAKNKLVASYGIYYQKPDDSFLTQTASLDYEKSIQYALEYELKVLFRVLRVSAYLKDYQQLVKIKTPVFSGFQAYGPPMQISDFNNKGKGYARGFDVFWKDKQSMDLTEYYVSYSFLDTKRDYIDFESAARPSFAPKHTFNLVAMRGTRDVRWQFSGTYTYSSGRSYFNPLSKVFMSERTQNNHNVSLGITHLPGWIKGFSAFNLNVNNVFGFKNVYGYRYAYDGSRREAVLPPAKRSFLLSFLMNIDGDDFNH